MVLFKVPSEKIESLFLEALDKKVGGGVIKPLFSYFGEDLYLILSILNGTYKHFPSLKVLKSLLIQCELYDQVQKKMVKNLSKEDALIESAFEIGLSVKKAQQLYERFSQQLNLS